MFKAKCNIDKVIAILKDYQNLDEEVKEIEAKIQDPKNVEIISIYRKLKMLNHVRMKLIERI